MSKKAIKKEIQNLQRTISNASKIWKFRGRRVVPAEDWKYGDWSKFPDSHHILAVMGSHVPKDWWKDYMALLEKVKDPDYAKDRCYYCAIYRSQELKKELDRRQKHWEENGGENAKQKFYERCGEPKTSEFRREDAMRDVEWRLYNEAAEADNRTCTVLNYFQCPFGDDWRELIEGGYSIYLLWKHIEWYDRHWNGSTTWTPLASDSKWFHFGEPAIIDVKDFQDMIKAIEDGRLDKIIAEHDRYMKETGAEIWNL